MVLTISCVCILYENAKCSVGNWRCAIRALVLYCFLSFSLRFAKHKWIRTALSLMSLQALQDHRCWWLVAGKQVVVDWVHGSTLDSSCTFDSSSWATAASRTPKTKNQNSVPQCTTFRFLRSATETSHLAICILIIQMIQFWDCFGLIH